MRNDELMADLLLPDKIIYIFFRIYTRGRCDAQNRKVTLSTVKKSHSGMGLSKVHVFCVLARDDTQHPKHSKTLYAPLTENIIFLSSLYSSLSKVASVMSYFAHLIWSLNSAFVYLYHN